MYPNKTQNTAIPTKNYSWNGIIEFLQDHVRQTMIKQNEWLLERQQLTVIDSNFIRIEQIVKIRRRTKSSRFNQPRFDEKNKNVGILSQKREVILLMYIMQG